MTRSPSSTAVSSLFTGTFNRLGAFESGPATALIGAVPAVLLGGLGTIAVASLWMAQFPEFRRLCTFEERPAALGRWTHHRGHGRAFDNPRVRRQCERAR